MSEQAAPRSPKPFWVEAGRLIRAQISTGIATGLEWLLMTGLVVAGVHYLVAAAAGALLGGATDFSIKKWWVFGAGRGLLRAQAVRYAGVSAASAGLNSVVAYLLVDGAGLPAVPGVILASVVVGLAWNYPLHRLFVFPSQPASPDF